MSTSYRLRLSSAAPGAATSERWRGIAKRALSLGAAEADRVYEALPLVLVLAPTADEERTRLEAWLREAELRVELEPVGAGLGRCARHPRLLEGEVCPKCSGRTCAACLHLAGGSCPRCATRAQRWATFRHVRITILLAILGIVALAAFVDSRRIASWKAPLTVVLHPIAGDRSGAVASYVRQLDVDRFASVARFFDREARRYGLQVDPAPVELELGPELTELPPAAPEARRAERGETSPESVPRRGPSGETPSALDAITWSLRYRYWVFRVARDRSLPRADVRMFLVFHEGAPGLELAHSVGLAKARSGVAHLFALDRAEGTNAVVVAHEILHAVGADDRYDESGRPRVPEGLADPTRSPRYPQEEAEIMAGSIPLSASDTKLPESLDQCLVGPTTAAELGWTAR